MAWRIIFLNVAGLLALLIGVLHVAQFRAVLIDTRLQRFPIHRLRRDSLTLGIRAEAGILRHLREGVPERIDASGATPGLAKTVPGASRRRSAGARFSGQSRRPGASSCANGPTIRTNV